jgi:hypothetical protein
MSSAPGNSSDVLAAMADGIGDLTFMSDDWIDAAHDVLNVQVAKHADAIKDSGSFTLCEVAHNPPAYLRLGPKLSWYAQFKDGDVEVGAGELPENECDFRVEGDHSILSNLARLQYPGRDPAVVARAQARLAKLSKWKMHGSPSSHKALASVLASLHGEFAARTMPRFVFMTPEWVSTARHLLTTRAMSEKYADGLTDVEYTFAEEFTHTPGYAFPDGSHGGFWVRCDRGSITVGAGPLPEALGPADALTIGMYAPIVPVGRTVNSAMTEGEQAQQAEYATAAFRFDKVAKRRPVEQSSPSGKGDMPVALARIFKPLHDLLSRRTSGELPVDYDASLKSEWAAPQAFDRASSYDPSWIRYDKVDIHGQPID